MDLGDYHRGARQPPVLELAHRPLFSEEPAGRLPLAAPARKARPSALLAKGKLPPKGPSRLPPPAGPPPAPQGDNWGCLGGHRATAMPTAPLGQLARASKAAWLPGASADPDWRTRTRLSSALASAPPAAANGPG